MGMAVSNRGASEGCADAVLACSAPIPTAVPRPTLPQLLASKIHPGRNPYGPDSAKETG